MKRNVHLQVMITQEMMDKISQRARKNGLNTSEVVRAILAANLRNTKPLERSDEA